MKKYVVFLLFVIPIVLVAQTIDTNPRGLTAVTFANLGTPANGTIVYCSDCTAANPAAGSGTGAVARRENGAWNSGSPSSSAPTRAISFTLGDPTNASALTTSYTAYVTVPFSCTISAYNLLVNATDTTLRVKFWKIATGTAIPTVTQSISTSGLGVPSGTAVHSTTLSDFTTTTVTANDILAMNVSVANTAKMVNGVLQCQ